MILTDEQKWAVQCPEHLMLTACPGSGKTRSITSKLARVLADVRETPRSIACITYTNAAVHEIESRLRRHIQPGDDARYEICTIHSFCLNNIFRPFCYLIKGYKKGFKVLTPESPEFEQHVTAVCAQHGRYNLAYKDFEEFAQLRIDKDGQPVGPSLDSGALTSAIALAYWKRIRQAGFVDFANIIYFSLVLLDKRPEILSYIASRFAWILVDEFQDTTDLQIDIFLAIAKAGQTRFFLVGDPCQSIYSFAGARPDLAGQFAAQIHARTDHQLSGNFRSSRPIVAQANLLYPRTPPMTAVGRSKEFAEIPQHKHGRTPFEVITDEFLPLLDDLGIPIGDAAILAPTWFSLFPLARKLREYGLSVVGPGARPYRRTRHFAQLAEQVCGYLMEPRPEAILGIERTLFNTLLDITGRTHFGIFSYEGRLTVFRLLEHGQRLHDAHMSATTWLEATAGAFSTELVQDGYLAPAEQGIFAMSVEEMKADMRNNKIDLANLTIEDLGVYASPDAALKLSTIHNAKGREYEAVAMIDLHEGRIPFYQAQSAAEIEEAKRLFYVGLTRAKRILLYVTDTSNWRNVPSRFLRASGGVGVC